MPWRGWWRRRSWVVALAGIIVVGVGTAVYAFPSVAATACPSCFGLVEISPGVFAEPGLTSSQRTHIIDTVRAAEQRIANFYQGQQSRPTILACSSAGCYRHIGGGGEKGVGVLNRAVMLSPDGLNPVIATHELSHIELHARLGDAQVPQWFDEGLAVVVSNDPRYLGPLATPDRCLVSPIGPLPATLHDWLHAATADQRLYAMAGCQVDRWITAHGGPPAVLILIRRLAAGEQFTQLR